MEILLAVHPPWIGEITMAPNNLVPVDDNDDATITELQRIQARSDEDSLARLRQRNAKAVPLAASPAPTGGSVNPTMEVDDGGQGRSFISSLGRNVADIPLSIGHGAMEGVNEAIRTIYDVGLGRTLQNVQSAVGIEPTKVESNWNPFNEPNTITGEITSGISQFLTGFAAGGMALKPIKAVGPLARFGKSMAQSSFADYAFFDDQQQRLSNVIQDTPLANPINEFLMSGEDDSALEGRLKNAVEGLGFGAATEGVTRSLGAAAKAIRNGRSAAAVAAANGVPTTRPALPPRSTTLDEIDNLADMALVEERLADPDIEAVLADDLADVANPATAGRTGQKDFFINFSRIDTPDDVKDAMQAMSNKYADDLNAARRGEKMTFRQVELNAEQENAWEILSKRRQGEPLNAEQSLAARNLWAESATRLSEASEALLINNTPENQYAFMKLLNVHSAIQTQVTAARTETARALASWRITSRAPDGMKIPKAIQLQQIEDMIRNAGGGDDIYKLAENINKLNSAGLVMEMEKVIEKTAGRLTLDMGQELWVSGLLSGPKTHIVNTLSNSFVALSQVLERGVAARLGRALGDDGGVALGEGLAILQGQVGALKDAFVYGFKAFMSNQGGGWAGKIDFPHDPAITGDAALKVLGRLPGASIVGGAVPSKVSSFVSTGFGKAIDLVGNVIRVPGRALLAEDEFFKTIGYRGELRGQAYRMAVDEAASGKITRDQIKDRIDDILDNPPDNIRVASTDAASYQTFTDAPGKFVENWQRITQKFPAFRFITPFVKTPSRIFNYTIAERTPLAPLFKKFQSEVARGGASEQLAYSRMALGTAVMLAAGDLAFSGTITGQGPANPAERQTLMRTGWQPNSIKIGDRYFSYQRLDPVATLLGVAANMAEIVNNYDDDDNDLPVHEAAIMFAASIAGNIVNKSYMSGISGLFEALSDPVRYSLGEANRFAASFVPTGIAEIARYNDPYMLETYNMLNAIRARIPGLSEKVPPRRDLWGRAMTYRSGLGKFYDAISPIYSRRENPEPIDMEMLRQEIYVAAPKRAVDFAQNVTVDLTRFGDAYSRYCMLAGNEAKIPALGNMGVMDYLNATVEGKSHYAALYRILSDGPYGGKAEHIQSAVNQGRQVAREIVLQEYPEIRQYVEEKKAKLPGKYNF
jgi:hypothetical protein